MDCSSLLVFLSTTITFDSAFSLRVPSANMKTLMIQKTGQTALLTLEDTLEGESQSPVVFRTFPWHQNFEEFPDACLPPRRALGGIPLGRDVPNKLGLHGIHPPSQCRRTKNGLDHTIRQIGSGDLADSAVTDLSMVSQESLKH